ncbi:glutamate-1-semialdehyde 2,1-aminomutase [Candidatus Omnitrophota bacterium]
MVKERETIEMAYTANKLLFKQAEKYLVGGVNSPVRSFSYVGGNPLLIKKGKGSKISDYDGNTYIDYVLSYGALILGHAYPKVVESLKKAAENGFSFGATNLGEIKLAELIREAIPSIEKIRFVNSGTEAVMGAVRLARGYTGRDKVVKFRNAYHGHADYFLTKGGSGLASLGIPLSRGVPKDFIKHTIIADYGDQNLVERIFKKYGSQIAAVVVEPVGGNYGVITPDISFLKNLRRITKKFGTLLIFDEVITGFRFHYGSVVDIFSIRPDLICLGKIIGGGLPIGAFGGADRIMNNLAPLGRVYQASTFAGNPIVMSTGIATLKVLSSLQKRYDELTLNTEDLCRTIEDFAKQHNINLDISHYGPMFSFRFRTKSQFQRFYKIILNYGIYFAPSQYETNFVSFAHSTKDIEETKRLVIRALRTVSRLRR